jgi:magnesium chelatase subunit I
MTLPELRGDSAPEGYMPSALMNLLNRAGARAVLSAPSSDMGLAEHLPFPFLALVGQLEMRLALLLSVINPAVGGVLLIGPRGTGKTTAVRSLSALLPEITESTCPNGQGCTPEIFARYGREGICDDCAAKLERGESITRSTPVKLIELPLNARLDDVVGGVNERIAVQQSKIRLEPGILSRADQNLLYVDEVNLLEDTIVDAILDAAAAGSYTVRRGAVAGTYRSRFVLIGSMNPEEGRLRPQLLDRFGLRVVVRGLTDREERLLIYNRVRAYRSNPRAFIGEWAADTLDAREEIQAARKLLPEVTLSDAAVELTLQLVHDLEIDSARAEYTTFEAARAYAAADGRTCADAADIRAVAPMALRQRQSEFMVSFSKQQQAEDDDIRRRIDEITNRATDPKSHESESPTS